MRNGNSLDVKHRFGLRFHHLLFFMCTTRLFSINVQTNCYLFSVEHQFHQLQMYSMCMRFSIWCRQRQIKPHSVSMVGYLYSKCFLARFMLKWFHFIWRWVCVCSRTRTKLCDIHSAIHRFMWKGKAQTMKRFALFDSVQVFGWELKYHCNVKTCWICICLMLLWLPSTQIHTHTHIETVLPCIN